MGVNISGFVINRNLKEDIPAVEEAFGWRLRFQKEISGDEAMRSKYNSNLIDFHFTDKGTLAFVDDKYFRSNGFQKLSKNEYELMNFRFSETAMVFGMEFFGNPDNGTIWITYDDGFQINNQDTEATLHLNGQPIKITEGRDIVFDVFSEIMKTTVGVDINDLIDREKAQRYMLSLHQI